MSGHFNSEIVLRLTDRDFFGLGAAAYDVEAGLQIVGILYSHAIKSIDFSISKRFHVYTFHTGRKIFLDKDLLLGGRQLLAAGQSGR